METRTWIGRWLLSSAVLLAAMGTLQADDPLKDVKELYATAAYEESLLALAQVQDPLLLNEVEELRALCLLALHRDTEAERVVERLVLRHPLPLEGLDDRSPKFIALYQSVRRRLVPQLASGAYSEAKSRFEAKDYSTAAQQFGETLELVRSAADPIALRDLELLAREFHGLARERMTPVEAQPILEPVPPRPSVARIEPPSPPPFDPVPRVYDTADAEVTPPVVITQTMPPWNPPWKYVAQRSYSGRLQFVVGADGAVTSADILQPSFGPYDGLLLGAVKQWRYKPALKRGHAVQYRRVIDYVLKSPEQTSRQR